MRTVVTIAFFALILVPSAHGQEPAPGTNAPDPRGGTAGPLPKAPVEQFAPCTGIIDLKRRAACIQKQTTRGNPATKSATEKGTTATPDGRRKTQGSAQ
ncbi:MAG: hypothetical protein R3229_08725 [Alphaproteobacteria bacterium]|nr:hypothetical protein [Alphaproteobacteria bacterium]